MTRDELMTMAADKAARELSPESIEFLFRPLTAFELLCRIDVDGMERKIGESLQQDSVDPYGLAVANRCIQVERFYRQVKANLPKSVD